jgi:hypothetical protein
MTSTEAECKEFVNLMIGRWAGEIELTKDQPAIGKKKGDMVTSYHIRRAVADGRSFTTNIIEGDTLATDLCAYDAGSKQIRVMSSRSSGDFFEGIIWKKSATTWPFKINVASVKGQQDTIEGTIKFSNNGNTLTFEGPQGESVLARLNK